MHFSFSVGLGAVTNVFYIGAIITCASMRCQTRRIISIVWHRWFRASVSQLSRKVLHSRERAYVAPSEVLPKRVLFNSFCLLTTIDCLRARGGNLACLHTAILIGIPGIAPMLLNSFFFFFIWTWYGLVVAHNMSFCMQLKVRERERIAVT